METVEFFGETAFLDCTLFFITVLFYADTSSYTFVVVSFAIQLLIPRSNV